MENKEEFQVNSSDPRDFDCERATSLDQAMEVEEIGDSLADSMICDTGSLLIPNGSTNPVSTEDIVLFLNAGAVASRESTSGVCIVADKYFKGGDTFQTEDFITEDGDYTCVYQSARMGNFRYDIEDIPPGDYLVDLHFAEIININGPKGMRLFNVYVQDEKVLSDFDIFSIVGSNKPLQLVGVRVSIKDDGLLGLRFEGIHGSPTVSGICIRKADNSSAAVASGDYFVCTNCSAEIKYPSAQKKALRAKSIAKYEKDIQELKDTLRHKTEECRQSWMSWSAVNEELEKVRMQLDNKTFQTYSLDQTLEEQAEKLRQISSKYEQDQQSWTAAMDKLEKKMKEMKREHAELSREAHECVGSIPDLNQMVYAVQALVEQCEDLKVKYNDEQAMRRKFFNQVQEAKGNIRVFCRCRPLSAREVTGKCVSVVNFDAAKEGELGVINNGSTKKTFKFDRVYSPNEDQVDVFTDAAPMVISVLDGYNVCIFAYGQTGTGKTFTMEGTESNRGVNYRTLEELFKIANERKETNSYGISVSVLEVYNEQIRDLLAVETSKKLEIKQAPEGSHHIPGIVEANVENINEVWNVLQAGSSARAVGSNNVNEHSSRSHCILCIMVKAKNLLTGESTKSKLWLVDLAGSERLAKTDVQGERLKEAQNINRSLSALGDVISALANKSSHIPYRNSKLTHLLQDSLGGDSKTLMFVQISPSDQDLSETLSSLNFATRVRGVELGLARKQIDTSELQRVKAMLDKAKQECRSKDETLKKLEENLHNLDSKFKAKDQLYKSQVDKIRELESQLELKMSFHCQSQKEISQLSERLNGKEEYCARLQQKVNDLENKLRQQEEIQSAIYQKKVIDLEERLREQMKESESSSLVLQQKVKELENEVKELEKELKEQEQNPEVLSLRQKVKEAEETLKEQKHDAEILSLRQKLKEVEDKVRDQARQLECTMISEPTITDISRSTPMESKQAVRGDVMNATTISRSTPIENKQAVREDVMSEAEHRILRSSNSVNRRVSQGAVPVKENDSVRHEMVRRKRLSRNSEVENNIVAVPSPVRDNRNGPSDAPKPFSRLARPPTKPTVAAQKPIVRTKTSRDPAPGVKERETKKRLWSR